MQVKTLQHAKINLEPLIRQTQADGEPIMILLDDDRKAVLLSERAFNALQETEYLLSNPANAAHLKTSLEQALAGKVSERDLGVSGGLSFTQPLNDNPPENSPARCKRGYLAGPTAPFRLAHW